MGVPSPPGPLTQHHAQSSQATVKKLAVSHCEPRGRNAPPPPTHSSLPPPRLSKVDNVYHTFHSTDINPRPGPKTYKPERAGGQLSPTDQGPTGSDGAHPTEHTRRSPGTMPSQRWREHRGHTGAFAQSQLGKQKKGPSEISVLLSAD